MNAQARAKAPEGLQCQERMWAPSLTFHVQAQEANCHVAEPMRLQRKLNLLHFASWAAYLTLCLVWAGPKRQAPPERAGQPTRGMELPWHA